MRKFWKHLDRGLGLICGTGVVLYQVVVAPFRMVLFGPTCRFYPSCSAYARQCFQEHSFPQAFFMVLRRLSRCHPLHPGGFDPVPPSTPDRVCDDR